MIKISFHENLIITSSLDICHECILRWLPRNSLLDSYIKGMKYELSKPIKKKDENIDGFQVEDSGHRILYKGNKIPPHPECKRNHKMKNQYLSKKDVLYNQSFWHSSIRNSIDYKFNEVMTAFNAPINSNSRFVSGWGDGENLQEASNKSLIEALERFHTHLFPKNSCIIEGKERDFYPHKKFEHFPNKCTEFSSDFMYYNPNIIRKWVRAKSLINSKHHFIPLDYVVLKEHKLENRFFSPTSTGMAAHYNLKRSIENSLLEYIERYGQYTFWFYNDFDKISINSIHSASLINKFKHLKLNENNLNIFHKLLFNTHVIILSINNENKQYIFGSSASTSFELAIQKAISESIGQWKEYSNENISTPNSKSIENPIDHLWFYLKGSNSKYLEKYLRKKVVLKYNNKGTNFNLILGSLQKNNINAFLLDRGSILSTALGIYVTQIIIPKLPYLTFDNKGTYIPQNIKDKKYYLDIPHPFF